MRITYIVRTDGACDYYRVDLPLKCLAANTKGVNFIHRMTEAEVASAAARDDFKVLRYLSEAEIIVVPRLWGYKPMELLRQINPTAKIVLEYDDDMFKISPFSPHYKEHGFDEFEVILPGDKKITKVWEDGKNIDLAYNRQKAQETVKAITEADMVTVTTERLAERYRPFNKNVVALPNCIDLSRWNKLPLLPRQGIRLGWFGGSSHYEDWCVVSGILTRVMKENPSVKLVLMGVKFDGTLRGIPQDRIEFHKWIETPAYPLKAAILDLDLSLIPLRETEFNAGKSAIKYIEMASLGVPSVVSHVPPYSDIATEDNAFWIEKNDPQAWYDGLTLAIRDKDLREKTGIVAKNYVREKFDIEKNFHLWGKAYKEVLDGVSVLADIK